MHFNVYIDDKMGIKLNKLAKSSGQTRNSIIRTALAEWISNQIKPQWSDKVLSFRGINDFPPFESYRTELKDPKEDPLA